MKKTFILSGILVCIAMLQTSCVRETPELDGESSLVEISLRAGSGSASKSGFDGTDVVWRSGDMISVFDSALKNRKFSTEDSGKSADFTGRALESETYYALYPYLSSNEMTSPGKISVEFPSRQRVTPRNWADSVNLSIGKTAAPLYGSTMIMKNLGGYIEIALGESDSKIVALTVSSGAGENISGPASVDYTGEEPEVSPSAGGSTAITLIPEGESFSADSYFAVACPTTLSDGLNLSLRREDDYFGTIHHSAEQIKRNSFKGTVISVDLSQIEWKEPVKDTLKVEFVRYNESKDNYPIFQPFTENLPANLTSPSADRVEQMYYLKENGYPFFFSATYFTTNPNYGVRLGSAGDYILLPAMPGKRLESVSMVFGLNADIEYKAGIYTDSVNPVPVPGGEELSIGTEAQLKTFTWNLTESAEGTAYRLRRGEGNTHFRIFSLTLVYSGHDVAEVRSATINEAAIEDGTLSVDADITALHEEAGTISWGVEYRLEGATVWTAGPVGTGTKVQAAVEGLEDAVYFVRVWARADSYPPVYSEEYRIVLRAKLEISLLPFNAERWTWAGEGTVTFPTEENKKTTPNVELGIDPWILSGRYSLGFCRYDLVTKSAHAFDYWSDVDGYINVSTSSIIMLPGVKNYRLTKITITVSEKFAIYVVDAPNNTKATINGKAVYISGNKCLVDKPNVFDLNAKLADAPTQPGVPYYISPQNSKTEMQIKQLDLVYELSE